MVEYFSKFTDRMDIHIEEFRNTILVRQRWKYNWLNEPGTSPWTYVEKKNFHNQCDKLIWGIYGNYYDLEAFGDSDFVKRNKNKLFHVNFDIQWVTSNEHWRVEVTKSRNPKTFKSKMCWETREVILDSMDYEQFKLNSSFGKFDHITVAHEFGHTIGNVPFFKGMHWDEYRKDSEFFEDKSSMMNLGMMLRERHLDILLAYLNCMIKNVRFEHSTWF